MLKGMPESDFAFLLSTRHPRVRANLIEGWLRGGLQGGAPPDDPPTPPAAGATPPVTPPAAPPATPPATPSAAASGSTPPAPPPAAPVADPYEYFRSTIATLSKTIEDLKASGSAKEKDLKAAQEALDGFRKQEETRAESIFGELPEASRKKLEPFKGKLQLGDWIALIGAEKTAVAALAPGGAVLPPPTGSPTTQPQRNGDSYTPSQKGREMLEENMIGEEMLRKLDVVTRGNEDSKGEPVFTIKSLKKFIDMMKRPEVKQISLVNAAQRDHG